MRVREKNRRDGRELRVVSFPKRTVEDQGGDDATDVDLTYQERDLLDFYRQLSEEQQFQFKYAMQCEATRNVQARIARARSEAQQKGGA